MQEVDGESRVVEPPLPLTISTITADKGNDYVVGVPLTSVKGVRTERWRTNYILPCCIIVFLGVLAFQLIQWGYPSSIGYLAKYTEKTTVSGCQVFTNHVVQNVDKVKENIEANQIDCAKTPYVYMTGFEYSQQTSLMSCEHPLEGSLTPNCFVNNIIRNDKK